MIEGEQRRSVTREFINCSLKEFHALRSLGLVSLGVLLCAINEPVGAVVATAGVVLMHRDAKLLEQGKL